MRFRSLAIAFTLCCAAISSTLADNDTMLVTDSANSLLAVDAMNGAVLIINGLGIQSTNVAFRPDGQLFSTVPRYVYEIDHTNGWSTLLGAHGFGEPGNSYGIDALTFDADGQLYAGGNDAFIPIDTSTGTGKLLGSLGGHQPADDLSIDGQDGMVLATDADKLVEVRPNSSGATPFGMLPYDDVFAPGGTLYGLRGTNGILAANLRSEAATYMGQFDPDQLIGYPWSGSFPDQFAIPEPATILMMLAASFPAFSMSRKMMR